MSVGGCPTKISERGSSGPLLLLVLLLGSAALLLLLPYKSAVVDHVAGLTIHKGFQRNFPWSAGDSEQERRGNVDSGARGGGASRGRGGRGTGWEGVEGAQIGPVLLRSSKDEQRQLQLEFQCSTNEFFDSTPCSLVDASRYFVCNRRYPRTGQLVANSSAWQAYGNCELKPGTRPGACLFQRRQRHIPPSNVSSVENAPSANSSAGSNSTADGSTGGLQQAQQQQNHAEYIVILGDSQGMHYTEGLVRGLQALGANCSLLKREAGADYFGDPAGIAYRETDCGCPSFLTRCVHPTTQARKFSDTMERSRLSCCVCQVCMSFWRGGMVARWCTQNNQQ